jgi:hypothetical protein
MRKIFFVLAIAVLLTDCRKELAQPQPGEPHPQMRYKDLQNAEVKYLQGKAIDVDNDGTTDFLFQCCWWEMQYCKGIAFNFTPAPASTAIC